MMVHHFMIGAALLLMCPCQSFIVSKPVPRLGPSQLASSATKTDYDVVKVDLSDGRDYPIYIGAGFTEEEGKKSVYWSTFSC